jgi:uncharacterized protein (TIGR02265 family)
MGAPQERIVFSSFVDSYLKGLGPLVTPRTVEELKKAGMKFEKPPPAYPEKQMLQFVEIFARNAWPEEQHPERLRRLGVAALKGWSMTMLGSAVTGLMKVLGPRRALSQLTKGFKTSNNFSEASFQIVSDKEALVTVNDIQSIPTYWQGLLQGGLEVLGLEGKVTIDKQLPGPDATFRLTWK